MAAAETPNEFVRGPKWRTRTTPERRHGAAALTFALIVAVGLVVLWGCGWALQRLGSPTWVVTLPWIVPTAIVLVWTILRPTAAELTDDDDDSWFGYTIRWVLVGEIERRPAPVRIVAAVIFGAPVGWALVVFAILTVTGLL